MSRPIEPGLLRVFRYFTIVALFYFAALVVYTGIVTGEGLASVQIQWYVNFASNLFLYIYLTWPVLHRRLGRLFLPLALSVAAGVPILSNLVFLAPPVDRLSIVVEPTWLLFPTLMVTVVLIAWQYSFGVVLAFTIFEAVVELGVLVPLAGGLNAQTVPILGLTLERAFAFGLVGQIVCHLMALQRAQRRELIRANIQLGQQAATQEQLAVSRERNRLARELHDTLAHTLSGQAVNLEAIKLVIPPEQSEAQRMLDQTLKITRDGLSEVRRALKDLRSQTLDDLGLAVAVRNLALEAAARADFSLDLHVDENLPRLGVEVEQAVYRIAQESLANVVHHANAGMVSLSLGMEDHRLALSICDDGCGAELELVDPQVQHGLLGMRERAAMVGGDLSVESRPGNGTRVDFSLEAAGD